MKRPPQKTADEPLPQSVTGYTAPLDLVNHLHRPKMKLDLVPVLDLLVIALLMSMLFTRFVMVPGVRVDLPDSELRMPNLDASVSVLTIGNKGMLYFDGSVYEKTTIRRALEQHVEAGEQAEEHVLLVKVEGTMHLQVFLELCSMAQQAGFTQVQIAGEKETEESELFPSGDMRESLAFPAPVM